MSCFPCFKNSDENKDEEINDTDVPEAQPKFDRLSTPQPRENQNGDATTIDSSTIEAKNFTFRELATATKNFRRETLLGESGFGQIYKGTLQPSGEVIYVKRLDKNSLHGNKEFLVEVLMLSLLHHPNLLDLVGYCADGDQRLLVYEYMQMGSVEGHLLDMESEKKPLDWRTRMKIACGIAQGLEYLHETAKPAIIYRDLKCSNILLDDEFNPKLSDHGLAKLGGNNKAQVTVLGDNGYNAPEYEKHGELTLKSDVYNFGIILLELITGRRAVDTSRPFDEQNLVKWAQPIFRDPKRFPEMADPRLASFPVKSLNQVVGIAAMCLQDEPDVRPFMSDVVATLSFLSMAPAEDAPAQATPPKIESPKDEQAPPPPPEIKAPSRKESHRDNADDSEDESSESSSSDDEESLDQNHNEQKYDCMDDEKAASDHESDSSEMSSSSSDDEEKEQPQEKENSSSSSDDEEKEQQQETENIVSSMEHNNSLEYEVASMSTSVSNSDNESRLPSIKETSTEKPKSKHGRNSSKWRSAIAITKRIKRHKEEKHEGTTTTTNTRRSSRIKSERVSSKGRNVCDVKKNQSVRLSSKGKNGHEFEKKKSDRLSSKDKDGHEFEKKTSDRLSSKGKSGGENERKQSLRSYSRESSIAESKNGSSKSGHNSDSDESEEESLL